MTDLKLHIISFDVPYPADYGGVLDVFHKIRHLRGLGVKVHLHCFDYGRGQQPELENYCEKVSYYPRKTGLKSFISVVPYIIKSRMSEELVENLLKDSYPIICEGIHTAGILFDKRLLGRKIAIRPTNIEFDYYRLLAQKERNPFKKYYFISEAVKLTFYNGLHKKSSMVLPVSDADYEYFNRTFPKLKNVLIYPFNAFDEVHILPGKGSFALFHGNLSVSENIHIAEFLIKKIATGTNYPICIAGKNPPESLSKLAKGSQVIIIPNPTEKQMIQLIREAQMQLMITFQPTGFKHKLLQSVFMGRHIIANSEMLSGSHLEHLIHSVETAEDIILKMKQLSEVEFTPQMIAERKSGIPPEFFNDFKVRKLVEIMM